MTSETFVIAAIDPGNNTGVAILTVSLPKYNIVKIETKTIVLENKVRETTDDRLLERLTILDKFICKLQREYAIKALGIETAFLNNRFPKAVMQLSQYYAIVTTRAIINNPFIKLFKYSPRYIKKYIGAGGNADKDDMLANLLTIKEVTDCIKLSTLTEHEIDAVSIAYVMLEEIKKYPTVMCKL